jgi:IS30 family transposase
MKPFISMFIRTRLKEGSIERTSASRSKKENDMRVGPRDRRGQITNKLPLSERKLHIEAKKQVDNWECDTVIGANHKGYVVTMFERKNEYTVMTNLSKKNFEFLS